MSVRLKDRLAGIPYGFKFLVPQTKWQPAPWASFDAVVKELIRHLQGNPQIVKQLGWTSLEYDYVADKVDEYNAQICKSLGWNHFLVDNPAPIPKSQPRPGHAVRAAVVGAETILEMFGKEGPITDKTLASARAQVCSECPQNAPALAWERFFTVPASNLIRKALGLLKDLDLSTPIDDKLGVCQACLCPLKLKVHARLPHILAHIAPEDKANLDTRCWITHPIAPDS